MVCPSCQSTVAETGNFCPRCGAPLPHPAAAPAWNQAPPSAYPVFMPAPRVERNLQGLGIAWCLYGAYRIVAALIAIFVLRAFTMRSYFFGWPFSSGFGGEAPPHWILALLPVIAVVAVSAAALALFVGYGLLNRKPWGRTLAIVAAVLSLLKIPLGTALGIYTLWVLAPSRSGMEYDALAAEQQG